MSPNIEPLALSPAAAARFVGVSVRTMYTLLADGSVIARKHGKRTLVDAASLRSWFAALPAHESGAPLFPKGSRS